MCSTERARRRCRSSRNASRRNYVAVQNFVIISSGCFLATNSLTTQSWLLQNTASKTKFDNFPFTTEAGFMLPIIFLFSFLSFGLFNYRLQYMNKHTKYNGKRGKQFQTGKIKNDKARSAAVIKSQKDNNSYGIPPWKTGAAFPSRPLFRVFPWGDSDSKAEAKLGSLTTAIFSGTGRRTWNFKLTRQLNGAPRHFLFSLSRSWKMTTMSSNLTRRSNNGHIIKLLLFDDCRNAGIILWRRFTRRRPHTT